MEGRPDREIAADLEHLAHGLNPARAHHQPSPA
jgi:hypothetical protein